MLIVMRFSHLFNLHLKVSRTFTTTCIQSAKKTLKNEDDKNCYLSQTHPFFCWYHGDGANRTQDLAHGTISKLHFNPQIHVLEARHSTATKWVLTLQSYE